MLYSVPGITETLDVWYIRTAQAMCAQTVCQLRPNLGHVRGRPFWDQIRTNSAELGTGTKTFRRHTEENRPGEGAVASGRRCGFRRVRGSSPPATRSLPSGLKATPRTSSPCGSSASRSAERRIPGPAAQRPRPAATSASSDHGPRGAARLSSVPPAASPLRTLSWKPSSDLGGAPKGAAGRGSAVALGTPAATGRAGLVPPKGTPFPEISTP